MLVTKMSPSFGADLCTVPTTWFFAFTERSSWPSAPFKYCSYSFSSPLWPTWLDGE